MAKRMNLAGAVVVSLGLTVTNVAHGFVCTDSSGSVDWIGVDFDVDNGPCPTSALVTDGAGTASAQADLSTPDTVALEIAFELTSPSFFSGDIESEAIVSFDVGAGGAELAFQSSGAVDDLYSLSGPGVALTDVPVEDGSLALPTAGSYELTISQAYNGGAATSPFFGSTSATLLQPNVLVPIGNFARVLTALALVTLGAFAVRSRPYC